MMVLRVLRRLASSWRIRMRIMPFSARKRMDFSLRARITIFSCSSRLWPLYWRAGWARASSSSWRRISICWSTTTSSSRITASWNSCAVSGRARAFAWRSTRRVLSAYRRRNTSTASRAGALTGSCQKQCCTSSRRMFLSRTMAASTRAPSRATSMWVLSIPRGKRSRRRRWKGGRAMRAVTKRRSNSGALRRESRRFTKHPRDRSSETAGQSVLLCNQLPMSAAMILSSISMRTANSSPR